MQPPEGVIERCKDRRNSNIGAQYATRGCTDVHTKSVRGGVGQWQVSFVVTERKVAAWRYWRAQNHGLFGAFVPRIELECSNTERRVLHNTLGGKADVVVAAPFARQRQRVAWTNVRWQARNARLNVVDSQRQQLSFLKSRTVHKRCCQ